MKKIKIGDKEYTFEFTIEASLFNECTEKLTNFITDINEAQNKNDLKQVFASISDIPQTALTMFYAGLLEHHGEDGDGTVLSKKDAKKLIKEYFAENKDNEKSDFYSILTEMFECMNDDGFFEIVGLTKMYKEGQKTQEVPQINQTKK